MARIKRTTGLNNYTVQEATNLISQRKIIRLNPALATANHSTGDVIFNNLEIPNAVPFNGGISRLEWMTCYVIDDTTSLDIHFVFHQKSGENLGTVGSGGSISGADFHALKPLVVASFDSSDNQDDLGAVLIATNGLGSTASSGGNNQVYLKAESDSRSVYMGALLLSNLNFDQVADSLYIVLGIKY